MSNLIEFAKRIEDELTGARREPYWGPGEAEQYMADIEERSLRFKTIAEQYTKNVIQPRLETLASYFINANLSKDEPTGHCECWFGYCERFPANTRVAFAVEHDIRFEKLVVCYDVSMIPLFIRINEHDRLTLTFDQVSADRVNDWIEIRLLEFLADYLQIDRGLDDFEDEPAIDPVCGMRISRSSAATSGSYYGHPYFFCSEKCHKKFEDAPEHFARIKTM